MALQFEVVTLFPGFIRAYLEEGVVGRAAARGLLRVGTEDPRSHAIDVHRTVDDRPYGGGPGMVMKPEPLAAAIGAAAARLPPGSPVVALSAQGRPFDQRRARDFSGLPGLLLVAGRYEGVDQRVLDARDIEEISIGDYVLSGGDLAAQVLMDACVRLLPGVLGNVGTLTEESFASGLLEYPHYTRPRDFEGHTIPDVLLSGDHEKIDKWRREQAEEFTKTRRPDLWEKRGKSRT